MDRLYFVGYPISMLDAILLESLGQTVRAASFFVPGSYGIQEGGYIALGLILGLPTSYCLAMALGHADATVIIPIDFLRLPLAAVIGFVLHQEVFEVEVLVGAMVVFVGNYYNIRRETSAKSTI